MVTLKNRNAVLIGIIGVVIIMLPYIFLGEDAFITIHDFLDSGPVHVKTILSLGLIGNPGGVLPVLDGVPSLNYVSLIPIDIKTILYIILPLYWAIVCNIFFVKLMAFIGMYVLCYNYVIKGNALYSLLVAALFCLIPFYADCGLSSAGVPLFLYCTLNFENKIKSWLSYVLIVFFACNSSFVLVGVFLCLLWGSWIIYKWLVERTLPKSHIFGMVLLIIVYLFVNISIIYNYFFPTDIISHRVEFSESLSIYDLFIGTLDCYMFSQYHAGSFNAVLILIITFAVYAIYWRKDNKLKNYVFAFFLLCSLILIGKLLGKMPWTITHSFQFDRFYFLYPSLCFILLAKAFSLVRYKWFIVGLSMVLAMKIIVVDGTLLTNVRSIIGKNMDVTPSFKHFFDEQLFAEIKKDLRIKDNFTCKVVSLGMYPSVAEYNNFYTLDSYVFSYSLDYKHRFRKIIKGELEKSEALRKYFDGWGSRCYMFSSELGFNYLVNRNDNVCLSDFDIDTLLLKDLGCEYIFSAVDIMNFRDLNLSYVNSYTTDHSFYKIRVYKLN